MSHAEYASRPVPVFTKLAGMLRSIPALQFLVARVSALLRGATGSSQPSISKFLGEAPGVAKDTVRHVAVLKLSGDIVSAAPEPSDQSERAQLIRRRWAETGIKMWNPGTYGAGHAVLNIQGRAGLLPVKPGETQPGYDKLEFKLIEGQIVCEGVVVDPPKPRK